MEMVTTQARSGGLMAFAREAAALILRREMILPALLLALVLTTSNILILLSGPPVRGTMPHWQFIAAALLRLVGVLVLLVAILRIATGSQRPRWRPDGAFWLYALALLATLGVSALMGRVLADRTQWSGMLIDQIATSILVAPFAAWVAAMAVATPLAWRPLPWLRGLGHWLPHYLFWSLLLVSPLGLAHGLIDLRLVLGGGENFWPLALFDGPLSTLLALVGLGLGAAGYRRVA